MDAAGGQISCGGTAIAICVSVSPGQFCSGEEKINGLVLKFVIKIRKAILIVKSKNTGR
jgi:hypothetical protein